MRILVGTSGWSYKEWKGTLLPRGSPGRRHAAALRHPAPRGGDQQLVLPHPQGEGAAGMGRPGAGGVPVRAQGLPPDHPHQPAERGRRLAGLFPPHRKRAGREARAHPVPVPPSLKKDVGRLREFLARLPRTWRAALEFRHASWFDEEVYDVLRGHDVALVAVDEDEESWPLVPTACWGYLRLRRSGYGTPTWRAGRTGSGANPGARPTPFSSTRRIVRPDRTPPSS